MATPDAVRAVVRRLSVQLGAAVHAALAPGLRSGLPEVIRHGIAQARAAASELLRQAWAVGGGSPGAPALRALQDDLDRAYGELQPEQASREAADKLILRSRLALSAAGGLSHTDAVLAEGRRRQAAGEHIMKVWRSRLKPTTCRWCRELHGMMIPLEDEFPHGDPVALPQKRTRHVATPAGAHHYHRGIGSPIIFTFPPKAYLGVLLGPLRHPRCECELELVVVTDEPMPEPAQPRVPAMEAPHVLASDIAALPEAQYQSLISFLRAATHELGQLLRRLRGV
jgi:hypothetical protein